MARSVTLTFLLNEDVTPCLFAEKVAMAVSAGALRSGEKVMLAQSPLACKVRSHEELPGATVTGNSTSAIHCWTITDQPVKFPLDEDKNNG
jgi:hypothetical protein